MSSFLTEHVSCHVIRCSFCKNNVRVDVKPGGVKRGGTVENGLQHEQAKRDVENQAKEDGWKSASTNHGAQLNFCPDHVNVGKEMGLLAS